MAKRFERREEAKEGGEEAKEVGTSCCPAVVTCVVGDRANILILTSGTVEEVDKFSRRQVRVTKEHNEECRKLLGLMGIPVVVVRLVSLYSLLIY